MVISPCSTSSFSAFWTPRLDTPKIVARPDGWTSLSSRSKFKTSPKTASCRLVSGLSSLGTSKTQDRNESYQSFPLASFGENQCCCSLDGGTGKYSLPSRVTSFLCSRHFNAS